MTEAEAVQLYFRANASARRIFEIIVHWDYEKSPKENALDIGISHQTAINMANRFGLYKKILTK